MEKIVKFIRDEDGLELTEYAVMGALVVAAIFGVIFALRTQIQAVFQRITDALATANA